jgi:hypothetical protein
VLKLDSVSNLSLNSLLSVSSSLESIVQDVMSESLAADAAATEVASAAQRHEASAKREHAKEQARDEHAQQKSARYANKALDAAEKIVCKAFVADPVRSTLCAACRRHAMDHFAYETPKKLAREQIKRREATDLPPLHFTAEAELLKRLSLIESMLDEKVCWCSSALLPLPPSSLLLPRPPRPSHPPQVVTFTETPRTRTVVRIDPATLNRKCRTGCLRIVCRFVGAVGFLRLVGVTQEARAAQRVAQRAPPQRRRQWQSIALALALQGL